MFKGIVGMARTNGMILAMTTIRCPSHVHHPGCQESDYAALQHRRHHTEGGWKYLQIRDSKYKVWPAMILSAVALKLSSSTHFTAFFNYLFSFKHLMFELLTLPWCECCASIRNSASQLPLAFHIVSLLLHLHWLSITDIEIPYLSSL